ncbi:hypothetical protein N7478_007058 [Penicillium angulare]|uniref:uncharacterized protein n=1 Tax=Penicillium angulare TaxID=116970 RepID=UPI002540647C|nr:uncharacterized protein N7478_007058 [Penicillium angulare]KAJ5281686.1 hypothetical protein N7478_007058 [Penicillium angulare]
MKFSEILTLSAALAIASAAPMKRADDVEITFHGAAGAQFTQISASNLNILAILATKQKLTFPANPLSISKISSNTANIECTFTGINNSHTTVYGIAEVDVGPPQAQVTGTCRQLPSHRRRSDNILVTFIGAGDADFIQELPTDRSYQLINNVFSVSHIEVDDDVSCRFDGVDGSVTTITGPSTVDVGPPQTQKGGSCWIN